MSIGSVVNPTRRTFLRAVPVGAAAGLTLANGALLGAVAHAQTPSGGGAPSDSAGASFQLFTAAEIADDTKALDAAPGDHNFVLGKNFRVVLTVEKQKSAAEFEWHEGRDHILLVLDGSTTYAVGGTPKGAHSIGPGEWHAPDADGATALTLKKGDMMVIPRGTLHKRSTAQSVTFYLISPQ